MYRRSGYFNDDSNLDAGIGLIIRLNILMRNIEYSVDKGDLRAWNRHLDSIYRNVLYRGKKEVIYDPKTKEILRLEFLDEDMKIFKSFQKRLQVIMEEMRRAKESENIKELKRLNDIYYNITYEKDIWLRQVLFALKLYLKQAEYDPAKTRNIYDS